MIISWALPFCCSFAKAESKVDSLFQLALIKVESEYLDEDTQSKQSIFGMGTLVQALDQNNRIQWIVITTSHVSQGTGGIQLRLMAGPEKQRALVIENHPISEKPWRIANNTVDIEGFVVRPPSWLKELVEANEMASQGGNLKISFLPKYFGAHSRPHEQLLRKNV